jgi:hypothetical protein
VRAIESLGALRGEGRACGVVGGVGAECRPVPAFRACDANANVRHAQAAASTVPIPNGQDFFFNDQPYRWAHPISFPVKSGLNLKSVHIASSLQNVADFYD